MKNLFKMGLIALGMIAFGQAYADGTYNPGSQPTGQTQVYYNTPEVIPQPVYPAYYPSYYPPNQDIMPGQTQANDIYQQNQHRYPK